jgi:hypothetical protein
MLRVLCVEYVPRKWTIIKCECHPGSAYDTPATGATGTRTGVRDHNSINRPSVNRPSSSDAERVNARASFRETTIPKQGSGAGVQRFDVILEGCMQRSVMF